MVGLTPGRIVHYVLPNGVHRPAIVVAVWMGETISPKGELVAAPNGCCNLQVFLNGHYDEKYKMPGDQSDLLWVVDRPYSETCDAGTWHWIEKA